MDNPRDEVDMRVIMSCLRLFLRVAGVLIGTAFAGKVLFVLFVARPMAPVAKVTALLWGLRFDLAIGSAFALVLYLVAVGALAIRVRMPITLRVLGVAAVWVIALLHAGDTIYFTESGRHLGYEILDFGHDTGALVGTGLGRYPVISAASVLLACVASFAMLRLVPDVGDSTARREPYHRLQFVAGSLLVFVVGLVGARGGVQSIPLGPFMSQEIGDPRRAAFALNGAYNTTYYVLARQRQRDPRASWMNPEEASAVTTRLYPAPTSELPTTGADRPLNLVVILLESWAGEHLKSYGAMRDVAPHFDSLRAQSLSTTVMLAGGHRTSEGMFSTFCSYPNPLGSTIAETPLQEYDYACLPRFLRDRGYATEFLQGTRVNTSGIGAFSISLGFAQTFGREAIATRHLPENGWGVHDPDLYGFALERMRAASKPFFVAINTNSTHDVVLPPGVGPWFNDGSRVSAHLDVMHYADQALATFLAACAREPWARSTVFVLVADHGHGSDGSVMDGFVVPFAIYAPGLVAPRLVPRIATQRDIAPTVLEILGLPRHAWPMAGKSLLHDDEAPYFADYYRDGILGWITDNRLVEIPVVNPSQYKSFSIGADRRLLARAQDSLGARLVRDALAFTQFTQHLLSTGHTGQLPVSTP